MGNSRQCVPMKKDITVVLEYKWECVPICLVASWRVCMDYKKINAHTKKGHFIMPFMDKFLDRLSGVDDTLY